MPRTTEEIEAELTLLHAKKMEFLRPDTSSLGGTYNFSAALAGVERAIAACEQELIQADGPYDEEVQAI